MSTRPSVDDQIEFSNRLEELAKTCEKVDAAIEHGRNRRFQKNEDWGFARKHFIVAASGSQDLLLSAQRLFGDYANLDAWAIKHSLLGELESIIAYSIGLESEHLTGISNWMGSHLEFVQKTDDHPSGMIASRCRNIIRRFPFSSPDLMPASHMPRPIFFHDGEFRHPFIFKFMLRQSYDDFIEHMIESSRDDASQSAQWIQAINRMQGSKIVQDDLADRLKNVPVNGLETLREFSLSASTPSGDECSERTQTLVSSLVYGEMNSGTISLNLESIELNSAYFQRAFLSDVTDYLKNRCDYFHSNERGDEYDGGGRGARQFSDLFAASGLTALQLTSLAAGISGKFSRGKLLDMESMPPAKQLSEVIALVHDEESKDNITFRPDGNLRHAILAAVVRTLPHEMLKEVAQGDDVSKVMLYRITSKPAYLNGLENKRLAESLLGTDLGL